MTLFNTYEIIDNGKSFIETYKEGLSKSLTDVNKYMIKNNIIISSKEDFYIFTMTGIIMFFLDTRGSFCEEDLLENNYIDDISIDFKISQDMIWDSLDHAIEIIEMIFSKENLLKSKKINKKQNIIRVAKKLDS